MMLKIKDVSLHSLAVAIRWVSIFGTRRYNFSPNVQEWTQEQSDFIQKLCEEIDARYEGLRGAIIVNSKWTEEIYDDIGIRNKGVKDAITESLK